MPFLSSQICSTCSIPTQLIASPSFWLLRPKIILESYLAFTLHVYFLSKSYLSLLTSEYTHNLSSYWSEPSSPLACIITTASYLISSCSPSCLFSTQWQVCLLKWKSIIFLLKTIQSKPKLPVWSASPSFCSTFLQLHYPSYCSLNILATFLLQDLCTDCFPWLPLHVPM